MDRDQIQFPVRHLALREDVHQLGMLVGEMLGEQGGEGLYELVEGDRRAAIARRRGDANAGLDARVAGRPPAEARDLVRAFSTWFQAVNLAERVHRIRRRREYFLADAEKPQPGGILDALAGLKAQGLSLDQVLELLAGLRIEPILTAHPTESTRRTQLRRQQRMAAALLDRLNPNLDPTERRHLWDRLRIEITTGWQTEEHPRSRLTIADEREHVVFHLAEVLYRIVPAFYEEIVTALEDLYGACVTGLDMPPILRFGTWVGGDMEGAPEVNAKTIRETLQRQQQVIVNEYYNDCQKLSQMLSQSASRVEISAALKRRIDEYATLLPGARSVAPARHDQMPYRVYFALLGERLRQTWEGRGSRYERVEQFRSDLMLAARSLLANHGATAGYQLVRRLLVRVETFGFHLATLDLKQRSDVHHRVLSLGLDDARWVQRPPAEKLVRLTQILTRDEGPAAPLDALARRTLQVFDAAIHCRNRFGERAIGSYIIAGAAGPEDVLAPLVLARWAGAENAVLNEANLDFAPMFESHDSLVGAGETLRTLLAEPNYAAHLAARGGPQALLVGYSQGARDSGLISARLDVFDAQRGLAAAATASGRAFEICHARGGSIARGGMRIDALLRSAPPESVTGTLRLTEQGETISQSYGLRPNALRTLERAFGALSSSVASATAGSGAGAARPAESAAARECVTWIAQRSRELWLERMVRDLAFADFFRAATPIDVIERMQVGTRSIWDAGKGESSLLAVRSTPWVFAWSQARYFVPGWYGAGTALEGAIGQFGVEALRAARDEWPFFLQVLADVETQLARADFDIAGHYAQLATPALQRFEAELRDEHARCVAAILQIAGSTELLDGDRTLQRSIQLRNPYVDPMNLMQVDLLRRWRATARQDEDLFRALLASVSGIAQGLQTTG